MNALLAAAFAVLTVAAATDLLAAPRRRAPWLPSALCGVASADLALVGAMAVGGHPARLGLDGWVGLGPAALTADRLSGLFLLLSFAVATPVCATAADWARARRADAGGLGAATALLLGATALILTADHVFVFLFGWESLTLAFYLVTAYRRRTDTVAPSLLTLVFGKASGQLAMLGLLLAAARAGTFHLPGLQVLHGHAGAAAYVLLVAGFAVKVGLIPGQIWMPPGYAAAPGPVRALMAGVAVNVGFYGLWRTAALLGPPPGWLPLVLLIVGGVTALGGIAHATVQQRLHRVIAYSSIENAGLIIVGYAIALIGLDLRQPALTAVGLLAASLQVVAHAIAKSALFAAAGVIGSAHGTDDMERLRGVARRMPYSGTALAVGALTLAGLPPTVGFVSEWFLLEAIAQQFRVDPLPTRLALAVAGALVALTAGFAGVAFVRVLGFTVLGSPVAARRTGREAGVAGRAGLLTLAAGCLAVAAATPAEIRVLAAGLTPVVPADVTLGALKSPWVLQPVYPDFSILSPSWLWIMMPVLFAAALLGLWTLSKGGLTRVRRVPAWRSATAGVEGADQYTPFGYSHPTRKILAALLLTRNELAEVEAATGGRAGDETRGAAGSHLGYATDIVEVVEEYLYRPLRRPTMIAVRLVKRLQSGRLDAYLAYMLIALVAVLAVVAATV
ncbi:MULTISPECIES: proton-conducting transporter membrane subunit [Micromonospora]|uniref:NADH/ubiquinone/plastoquinone (Complex I) n=1 Tax=Micromonospora solifontis TaxID=2487138 RepID=A0ABX9WC12_9ACTN|nr:MULTISPECIES: proton-conducting transporter membrane subunit [Micromonospora]NES17006.1 NADH/ubiquinone/plastoquinone (complex I) [Micromonospora sp. PPF5-17B]NES38419.1 NADH/ubiquinone/plastoquinone (complex I) [Micromonospora solifontis]NES58713.1 NADH/ubiquinone/plastoquinone (complex I) [Micromonospora sp. PPF5-6]RNL95834.1 NADH/ubiquinone/plastoquinone (complex I) [Micromonospora solifontis]